MCDECLFTRREAAKFIKSLRESDQRESYVTLMENLIWIFDDAHGELVDVEITDDEVEQIMDQIQLM